jgi:uncharacterized sulfatase
MTDQQGADMVGAYGRPGLQTHCLDRLAGEGLLFSNAYTTCPVCTPARAGIFTGQYGSRNGAWANNMGLSGTVRTMGQMFQQAGYRTAFMGKWHLDGSDYFGDGICPPGWDEAYWYDGRRYLDSLEPDEIKLWRQGTDRDLKAHPDILTRTWAYRNAEKARRFIKEIQLESPRDERPFLLVVSFDEPHPPALCPYEYIERFRDYLYPLGPAAADDLGGKPRHQRRWAEARPAFQESGYLENPRLFGCNAFVDTQIGRIIDAVEQRKSSNESYIFYTADHGDLLGAHRLTGKGWCMYEENVRIPLLVKGPDVSPRGRSVAPVSHIDLLPTFLDLAGIPVPPVLEGRSLAPLLRDRVGSETPADDVEHPVFIEFNRFAINHDEGSLFPIRTLRRGSLKLVLNLFDIDELYDLSTDPSELENRIDDPRYRTDRNRLHDELLAWMDERRDPFRGEWWFHRPWREDSRNRSGSKSWFGRQRYRPDDGYRPRVLDYFTGKPADAPTSDR